ncbi:MAG: acetoin utilization protein AcuC [Gammaproteobacteria bacterium]|nr:acetoin utilization protein AcuC [Gammaproteobacteria bacterium]MCW8924150.1 acetoin utilization protein AcuC [Gammaproteobacteria bacterium]
MTKPSVAVVAGSQLADYHFGEDHPFGPYRHQAFLDGMDRLGLSSQVEWLEPVQCDIQSLQSFHKNEFVEMVRQRSDEGTGFLDSGDTPARKGIFEAASTVVGSVLEMIDKIMDKQFRRGFVPIAGLHHGYRDHCSGFCVFNDCAIAIEHLRRQHGLQKILYVDIDAHHGDGVFYNYDSDSNLFMVDFHEDGHFLYPGTGDVDETGCGPAKGTMLNFPMPMQANDADFSRLWPEAEAFIKLVKPEFIILQCGADAMKGDPITHLEFSQKSYQLAAERLSHIADEVCDGRMIALGGGGYNKENISLAWPVVVRAML